MPNKNWWTVELVLGVVLAGCGAQGGAGEVPSGPTITDGPAYFPLAIGNSWTYRISDPTGATAGGWRELLDCEMFEEDVYANRLLQTRPPVEL